jgi:cysteine-rich repeat protein
MRNSMLGCLMLVALGTGCEALVKFDRDKIGATGGAAGTGGTLTTGGSSGASMTTNGAAGSISGGAAGMAGNAGAGAGGTGGGALCGDGQIEPVEECDDGNEIEGDGCYQCKYDCGCPGCSAGAECKNCPAMGLSSFKDTGSKHCYTYNPTVATWDDARAACVGLGGDLAAPSTVAEGQSVLDLKHLPIFSAGDPNARCWTGGNDVATEGVFVWSNGEMWNAAPPGIAWSAGEPNGGTASNCVVIGPDATVRDRNCIEPLPFLCERGP